MTILFTDKNKHYSLKHHLDKLYTDKNQYHYKVNDLKKDYFLRFYPTREIGTYQLSDIHIYINKWLSRYDYRIPLKNIKALKDIKVIQKNDVLLFEVTGKDPFFEIALKKDLKNLAYENHTLFYRHFLDKLLISIIFSIVLFMIFKILKNTTRSNRFYIFLKLFLYATAFIFAIIKTSYYVDRVVAFHPPDESQHLAYVKYLHQHDSIVIPKFEEMRNIYDTGYNYLSHPPLYYHILNFDFNKDVTTNMNLPHFRHLSSLLFLLSLLILLYIGWQAKFKMIGDIVYLTILSSVPLFAYLGASINNDNLAFLASALYFLALFKLVQKKYTTSTYFLLGLSILVAYFAKLTVVVFIVISLFFYLLYLMFKKEMIKINLLQILMLIVLMIPVVYYQWYIYSHYHSLMPGFKITHPEAFLTSPYYVQEAQRVYLSPYEWFRKMSIFSFVGWFNIQSHNYFFKANWIDYIGSVTIQIFAIFALFKPCDKHYKTICTLGKITLLAFAGVFLVQYFFTYSNHLKYGYMGGTQSRYLLPFLASIALMSAIFINKYSKNIWIIGLVLILCLHAIYSDFFYFLLYYK